MKIVALLCALVGGCLANPKLFDMMKEESDKYSTFTGLIEQAGLKNMVNQGGLTVYAPNNHAFQRLGHDKLNALRHNSTALRNFIMYHMTSGSITSKDVYNDLVLTMENGQEARINTYKKNDLVTIQGQTIEEYDKEAINGWYHQIDNVMTPPHGNIFEYINSTSNLSYFLSLVLDTNSQNVLTTDGLTVFVPTDAAFAKLSDAVQLQIALDPTLMVSLMKYHMVQSTQFSHGLYDHEHLTSMDSGQRLTVDTAHHGSDIHINNAHVTQKDIALTNGVIHLIDTVLMPPSSGLPAVG